MCRDEALALEALDVRARGVCDTACRIASFWASSSPGWSFVLKTR